MNDEAVDAGDQEGLRGQQPKLQIGRTIWALYGLFGLLLFSGAFLLVRVFKGHEPLFDSLRVDVSVGATLVGLALVTGVVFRYLARRRGLTRTRS